MKYITVLVLAMFMYSCNRKVNIYFSNRSLYYNPLHLRLVVDDKVIVDTLFETNMISSDYYSIPYKTKKKGNCFHIHSDNADFMFDTCFRRNSNSVGLTFIFSVANKENLIGLPPPLDGDTIIEPKKFIFW